MLYYILWVVAALATGGIYYLSPSLHPALILPILIGFFVALCLLYLLFILVSPVVFPRGTPEHPSPYAAGSIRVALGWFMRIFCVRLRVVGAEKLPSEPVVYVCNHRSALDPVFIICGLRHRRMAFVSKESVLKYPIVGPHMRRAAFLGIDRSSPMQSMRAIHRAARYVREDGIDYGIFPEGTRSHSDELLPFKNGAFLLAKKADAPIVVLTMRGSDTALSRLPWHRPRIKITVTEIIGKEDVRALSHDELSEKARHAMQSDLYPKE